MSAATDITTGARQGDSPAPKGFAARRTFAIISHPDAGKTTLTEKLLLAGGAINMAGAVKARGENRRARSDWMEIEQSRGISVTSSVMTFEREGITFNLLDTPGHSDFSEDTYRTLTAVDSAIMVVDVAKGIESQTRKLFEICRLRDIPIITFANKVDREGRNAFEVMDEVEEALQLSVSPQVWPVGMGSDFHGCYDLFTNEYLYSSLRAGGPCDSVKQMTGIDDPALDAMVPEHVLTRFREEAELAREGYAPFDADAYRQGHLTPVVFGSALRDFSVDQLLRIVARFAPPPRSQPSDKGPVDPRTNAVSAFVFKVQANMDPNHRDRVAFVRFCSGHFKRGMKLNHVRSGKPLAVNNPIYFFAQERDLAEEAFAGDVIGIPNHGTLRVGDTLTEGETFRFTGLPSFAPEVMRRVRLEDTMRMKQLRRALEDLAEEGLVQVFKPVIGSNWIVGVVGPLQLDVLASRIKQEYKTDIGFEPVPFSTARWISSPDEKKLKTFIDENKMSVAEDRDGRPVFLPKGDWELRYARERNPDLRFDETRELVAT
ncbi:peptide chain release factor 3 [Aureimonas phyllosphaerae]|uniref:Peptide chain release factor 3 n=1 Tax=Aureimonas phyllosphaerae TaxID=1166078 RepID=A0A7W6BPW6_9HYPH|nr:peptide chain release factor 3 [Aureimonas phyllosphaerae]MBB3934732.1 peptide chain release factor 3 [Aureimonas phyllosphaerae]MBB3958053.1 peptide chain release factor 3 [Aureimonas phyllosphaerae]SFE91037.1 bacterial peptide chain release factor 3 (bRF-3) [Aureimonas phyllosphaerae]